MSHQNGDLQSSGSGFPDLSGLSDAQLLDFGATGDDSVDNQIYNSLYQGDINDNDNNLLQSNQLVRRNPNTQISYGQPLDRQHQWSSTSNGLKSAWEDDEDEATLEAKAAEAKREAQSKRPPKQIPPFIQKLSSFLDNNQNTDLIRWTDDGKAFVVLDEEAFANTLIPIFFKHKNFASFVRQLNMYGFNKQLGLGDNSMRASELKSKTPIVYKNKYFRRGRPELLWLITKSKQEPMTTKKGKRKRGDGEVSSEDEVDDGQHEPPAAASRNNKDLVNIPRTQWQSIQNEIAQLRRSQQQINSMISRFQHENSRYIREASAQHERHENSINAILQFLATFYKNSVEGNNNYGGMFGNAIPNKQATGNVTEVDETTGMNRAPQPRPVRKPLALLPPPPSPSVQDEADESPVEEGSSAARNDSHSSTSLYPSGSGKARGEMPPSPHSSGRSSPGSARVKEVVDSPDVSEFPDASVQRGKSQATQTSEPDILSILRTSNARAGTTPTDHSEFSSALHNFANIVSNTTMTPDERNSMLKMMAANSAPNTPADNKSALAPAATFPHWDQYRSNKETLDMLQRLQQEQDNKVHELAGRLQPLSPSGQIPGFPGGPDGDANALSNPPSDFDIDSFINNDYLQDLDTSGNFWNDGANDFDFSRAMGDDTAGNAGDGVGSVDDGLFNEGEHANKNNNDVNDNEDDDDDDADDEDQDRSTNTNSVGIAASRSRRTPRGEDNATGETAGSESGSVVDDDPSGGGSARTLRSRKRTKT